MVQEIFAPSKRSALVLKKKKNTLHLLLHYSGSGVFSPGACDPFQDYPLPVYFRGRRMAEKVAAAVALCEV